MTETTHIIPSLSVDSLPLLHLSAFVTEFAEPLGQLASPAWLQELLVPQASAPLSSDEAVRNATRALLRAGGFKPSGRSKPASEYLVRAAEQGGIPTINAAVDACNVVSLHSGIPISVVDLNRATGPFRVSVAAAGDTYVFNASGQVMDLEGLLCLFDADGPCANAVKDSQRTKTQDDTRRTLSILWGSRSLGTHTDLATHWYRQLLERVGATTLTIKPIAG